MDIPAPPEPRSNNPITGDGSPPPNPYLIFLNKLSSMGFANYDQYLASEIWQKFRKKFFRSSKPKHCACCKYPNYEVELHHRTYDRLGNERLTDVVPLCRIHHEQVHELLRVRYGGAVQYTGLVIAQVSLRKISHRNNRHIPDNHKRRNKKAGRDEFTD